MIKDQISYFVHQVTYCCNFYKVLTHEEWNLKHTWTITSSCIFKQSYSAGEYIEVLVGDRGYHVSHICWHPTLPRTSNWSREGLQPCPHKRQGTNRDGFLADWNLDFSALKASGLFLTGPVTSSLPVQSCTTLQLLVMRDCTVLLRRQWEDIDPSYSESSG